MNGIMLPLVLETAGKLLGLEAFRFGDALTQKFMVLRGEEITTPLTVEQVSLVMFEPEKN